MRFLSVSLALFAAASVSAEAVNATAFLEKLPQCALPCVIAGYTSSSPEILANPRAACTNNTLQAGVYKCVLRGCKFDDQIQLARAKGELCSGLPVESRAWAVNTVAITFGSLALIVVALRCYARYWLVRGLGSDDWLAVAAAFLLIPIMILQLYGGLATGFGRHVWDINPSNIESLQKNFYVAEILYITNITIVKISILAFYIRVFPSRWFLLADYVTMGIVIASGIAVFVPIVIQCSPISGAWDQSIDSKCININILSYASGAISVVLDLIILGLPIPALLGLHMNTRKKIGLVLMFSVGTIACITSMIRLKYLVDFTNSTDQTWDNSYPTIWSSIEICVALICASLPAVRTLLARLMPRIFNLSTDDGSFSSAPAGAGRPNLAYGHKNPTSSHVSTGKSHSNSRREKTGPSYNKRVIASPDEDILTKTPSEESFSKKGLFVDGKESQVWVQRTTEIQQTISKRDADAASFRGAHVSRRSQSNTSQESLWALEGTRVGDEENQEGTVLQPMSPVATSVGPGRERKRGERGGSFQRLWTPDERVGGKG